MDTAIKDLLDKIHDVVHWDWSVSVLPIQRTANRVVDLLARRAASLRLRKGSRFRGHSIKDQKDRRGFTHERIVRFEDGEPNFMLERLTELGWGFMYNSILLINIIVVREFYANFSSFTHPHVFLRGKKIPITEDAMCRHLGIPYEPPPFDMDDEYVATVNAHKQGEVNMANVLKIIEREGINWANNPTNETIPERPDNAILNAKATAWHKLTVANVDPKTHVTTFLMEHAILIFILMTQGTVNFPRIMRDIMVKRPPTPGMSFYILCLTLMRRTGTKSKLHILLIVRLHGVPCDRTVLSGRIKIKVKIEISNLRARSKPL
ncbi:hypothetical protein PIB30_084630 [Stylosanthes scabra]|uniref:Putative plant transposon protein domain-containing protein n=1 Tax=Stylosanthes scabra TaxID=79078 RepID=A0ABU6YTD4_9FABA|nr:hypothetical protein [Stylosanthes scabra]